MAPLLDEAQAEALLAAARRAAERAYAPYSDFPVGAAALTVDGSVVLGVNVENASFGLTICAERVAVGAAVAAGHRQLRAVAVAAPRKPGTTPCGACRQVLNEFVPRDEDLIVVLEGSGDRCRSYWPICCRARSGRGIWERRRRVGSPWSAFEYRPLDPP
jgi:cytidine deaminase